MPDNNFKEKGRWTDLFNFPNVVVHASLLPDGKVLHWGRRKDATRAPNKDDLDEHRTVSYLWTPPPYPEQPVKGTGFGNSEAITDENQPIYNPTGTKNEPVNVFCSGHSLLPSGNLLVVGGHISDGFGVEQASIFDYHAKKWIPQPKMNKGRWYPSALTLPDGRVLCLSGSDGKGRDGIYDPNTNNVPQIFSETGSPKTWIEGADAFASTNSELMLDLYPRVHIDPTNGQVFMAGPKPVSWVFKLKEAGGAEIKSSSGVFGRWTKAGTNRNEGARDYAPSVMYDSGKIMYIGGGADQITASDVTEFIDLKGTAKWESPKTAKMGTPRKQFNATVLPDGTVLVNGGTSGPGFNDLVPDRNGQNGPVLKAELMDPSVEPKRWVEMNPESLSRCYHGTTLLLPDGRVLSAGSGEAGGIPANECHKEGQLYEPPYLFKGARPTISSAPAAIAYDKEFPVTLGTNDSITKVSWVRLGSVTHCRNMTQTYMTLTVVKQDVSSPGLKLSVRAPANANISPPGHYMLFVLNAVGVPSVGSIIQIPIPPKSASLPASAPASNISLSARVASTAHHTGVAAQIQPSLMEHDEVVIAKQARPHVAVGLTPLCPYGLGPCWGGAYDGLQAVADIDVVRPMPNHSDSLAFVYLKQEILPDISVWRTEFEGVANKSYNIRGIEMTISDTVTKEKSGANEQLTLAGTSTRARLTLAPFQATSQVKWDAGAKAPKPITDAEIGAYERLAATLAGHPRGMTVQVTGTLQKHDGNKFSLDVREFEVLDAATS